MHNRDKEAQRTRKQVKRRPGTKKKRKGSDRVNTWRKGGKRKGCYTLGQTETLKPSSSYTTKKGA